jgi:antirestriction protein ArdC
MNVYEIITSRIIEKLEAGTAPWLKPWTGGEMPKNLTTGKTYRGANLFLLNMMNFSSPYWLTFRQCKERGGHVKPGEKATPIVFWNISKREDEDGEEREIPLLRYYNVFNVEQCEGLQVDAIAAEPQHFSPLTECERIINDMPNSPEIRHNEPRAYYVPAKDYVNMPKAETFHSSEEYYSTLFHELTHATGHSSRLNRKGLTVNAFGSSEYGKEELVAEMGAAFLCGSTRIENRVIDNSAAYVAGWLKAIKGDKKIFITAAAAAQKAADYILNIKEPSE